MKLIVNPHKIEIEKSPVNEREIDISKCEFEFADEITNEYAKEAYFTFKGTTYKQIIVNNECDFPSEVLAEKGQVEIGVVAFIVEDETEIKRYNPSPVYFNTWQGSLKDDYDNSEPITPTDKEQIEQAITNLQNDVDDLEENKQDTLVSGENIKTINGESLLGEGNIEIDQDFVKDDDYVHTDNNYTGAEKEKLAGLENYDDTEVKSDISDIKDEQTTQNQNITQNTTDIETINRNLINYSLITETGSQIALNVNSSNYQMTAILKDKNGNVIYTSNVIDLPIESMIINATYDSTTKEIVFTLQNGNVLRVSVADLVSGLVSTDELATILSSYYTKTEVDNLLSSKANASDVYTKSQTDNLLNAKADSSNVYTKSETDNLLSSKANSSDVYSKSETNNLLNAKVDTTTFETSQAEQDTSINALNSLVNQMPRVQDDGTDLELNPSLNYKLMKSDLKGNSSQDGTPTPSSPVPVKVVTGENSLVIQNANLFDINSNPLENRSSTRVGTTGYISLKKGTYTLSYVGADKSYYIYYDKNNVKIGESNWVTGNATFNLTDDYKLVFIFAKQNDTNISTNDVSNIMLVKGSTAPTSYVAHQEQNYSISLGDIKLYSTPDGTVRDYIYGSPNNWYIKKYWNKFYLTGDETIQTILSYNIPIFRIRNIYTTSVNFEWCSHYRYATQANLFNYAILSSYGDSLQIRDDRFLEEGVLDTEAYADYLKEQYNNGVPVTIYYPSSTPTDVQITDTTLIEQLNNIYNNAHSYNGTTNITTTYASGNEQMVIEASALMDLNSLVTRIETLESEV